MKLIDTVVLKITLADIEPVVLRRIVVPFDIRLDRLHTVMQHAMGWTDTHLWEFRIRGYGWGVPDPDYHDNPFDSRKESLRSVLNETGAKTLHYIYDFGDCWDHVIKIERTRTAPASLDPPVLLDASGATPPEDCGGAPGYSTFLADPEQRGDFDPAFVDIAQIERDLQMLADRWAPKPRRKKPVMQS